MPNSEQIYEGIVRYTFMLFVVCASIMTHRLRLFTWIDTQTHQMKWAYNLQCGFLALSICSCTRINININFRDKLIIKLWHAFRFNCLIKIFYTAYALISHRCLAGAVFFFILLWSFVGLQLQNIRSKNDWSVFEIENNNYLLHIKDLKIALTTFNSILLLF